MRTIIELSGHIYDLARAFDVQVHIVQKIEDSASYPLEKIIRIHPVDGEFVYAVALHELGHVLHPSGIVRHAAPKGAEQSINLKLMEETSAWEWAEHHALCWTLEMQAAKDFGMRTYEFSKLIEDLGGSAALGRLEQMRTAQVRRQRVTETMDDFLKRRKA